MLCNVLLLIFIPLPSIAVDINPNWINDVPQLFPRLPIAAPHSKDRQCQDDSIRLINSLKNGTNWAVSMWDASAKAPNGIVEAANLQLGDFDSCMMVKGPVRSKFCIAYYAMTISPSIENNASVYPRLRDRGSVSNRMFNPMDYVLWGLCIPASCSTGDMTYSVNAHLATLSQDPIYSDIVGNIANYSALVMEQSCTTSGEELQVKPGERALWIFVLVSLCLTVLCTFLEIFYADADRDSLLTKIIDCFSLRANLKALLTFKERDDRYPFTGFNFMKVISMFGIYFVHRTMSAAWTANEHYYGESEIEKPLFRVPIQMDYGPDTFLFITGTLTCFFVLQEFEKGFVNPISLFLVRIVRMLPLYYFAVWFHTVGVNRIADGPLWKLYAGNEVKICEKTWWVNLLLINNYYKEKEICMTTSWYVSADVHCFIVAIIILMIMRWKEKLAIVILIVLSILLMLPAIFKTYQEKIGIFFMFKNTFMMRPRDEPMFTDVYMKTHNRAASYYLGMLYGYFLYRTRHWKSQIPMWQAAILLCSSVLLFFGPSFILSKEVFEPVTDDNKLKVAVWGSLRRPMACIGIVLLAHVYRFRNLEFFKMLTESKFITFLSRMTYAFYLFHFAVILISASWVRYPTTGDWAVGVMNGISDCAVTLALAVVMTLIIDAPFQNILQKIVFAKAVRKWKSNEVELSSTRIANGHRF